MFNLQSRAWAQGNLEGEQRFLAAGKDQPPQRFRVGKCTHPEQEGWFRRVASQRVDAPASLDFISKEWNGFSEGERGSQEAIPGAQLPRSAPAEIHWARSGQHWSCFSG